MLYINILGILLIVLIVWWFWIYKPTQTDISANSATILVEDGVYTPAHIKIAANTPFTLNFLRKDASACAKIVEFPDFEISEELPLNKNKEIHLPPMKKGEYPFTCQMKMYRGSILVA